jgi:hypothetical protein
MYSTSIEPEKSSFEMQDILRRLGATHIITEYDNDTSEATGMFFVVEIDGRKVSFSIPIKWENIQQAMIKTGVQKQYSKSVEQCKRTAWRIALRWVQAQAALIQAGGAETVEAFMPYARVDHKGTTFYQKLRDQNFKMLPAPEEPGS